MNLLHARVVLRHRTLLDVADLAVRFLAAHPLPYLALAALVLVPSYVLALVVATTQGWFAGWCVAITLTAVVEVPFTVLASRLVFEEHVALDQVLVTALQKSGKVLVARLLTALGIGAGVLFLALPGIWISVVFFYATEVNVLEGLPIGSSLSRAQKIVGGEFGGALLTMLFLNVLHFAATVLADNAGRTILEELLQITPPPSMWDPNGGVLALAGFFLFVPYFATARILAYLNLRTRTEGWDVQTRFAGIAARQAEEETAPLSVHPPPLDRRAA